MNTTRANFTARRLLFGLVTATGVVLAAELLLFLISLVPSVGPLLVVPDAGPTLADDVLGLRPNPAYRDHDRRGFRNAEGIERADVVALGDSQTYGTGVAREAAWPAQLAALAEVATYNMGFPGYGPPHGLVLLDDALSLDPHVVVQSVYTGNDLWDSYNLVYERGQLPELLGDESRRRNINRANEDAPLQPRLEVLTRAYRQAEFSTSAADRPSVETAEPTSAAPLHDWLAAHSRSYAVAWRLYRELSRRRLQHRATDWTSLTETASRSERLWEPFEAGNLRTIFVPRYRLVALDIEDVRIREGLRLVVASLRLMHDRVEAAGARLVVLLIPTKMLVFDPWVVGERRSPEFDRLVAAELQTMATIRAEMMETGVVVVDTFPTLRRSNEQGLQPYPISQDGHPNAAGHRAIADALAPHVISVSGGEAR